MYDTEKANAIIQLEKKNRIGVSKRKKMRPKSFLFFDKNIEERIKFELIIKL